MIWLTDFNRFRMNLICLVFDMKFQRHVISSAEQFTVFLTTLVTLVDSSVPFILFAIYYWYYLATEVITCMYLVTVKLTKILSGTPFKDHCQTTKKWWIKKKQSKTSGIFNGAVVEFSVSIWDCIVHIFVSLGSVNVFGWANKIAS